MRAEIIKYGIYLLFFLLFFGASTRLILKGETRLGWAGVALWGTMFAVTVYSMIQDCFTREAKARRGEKARGAKLKSRSGRLKRLREHLISAWTIVTSILIGIASNLLTEKIEVWMNLLLAIWLVSFFFSLVFYPFQKRQKDGFDDFRLWAVYSAAMGVISIFFSYVGDWLRR